MADDNGTAPPEGIAYELLIRVNLRDEISLEARALNLPKIVELLRRAYDAARLEQTALRTVEVFLDKQRGIQVASKLTQFPPPPGRN